MKSLNLIHKLLRLKTHHLALIGSMISAVVIASLVATTIITHGNQATHYRLGETFTGKTAAILPTETDTLIFWQPWDSPTPLIAQSLLTGTQTGILPYPDVDPIRWQVAPADQDAFHIIWTEQDERLRSAVVSADGETQRGPITLDFQVMSDFAVIPLGQNQLVAIWRTGDQQITIQQLDGAGRPGLTTRLATPQLQHIAASIDRAGTLHLGWISSPAPNVYAIYYQAATLDNSELDTPLLLHTQDMISTSTITNLTLSLDHTHAYFIWEIMSAEPTLIRQQAHLLAFPLDDPAQAIDHALLIPQRTKNCARPTTTALTVGKLCEFVTGTDPTAEIRWINTPSGQPQDAALLFASIRTNQEWHPGIIVLQNGTVLGYRALSAQPADAGIPVISVSPTGQIMAAWSGIDGVIPELYVLQMD